MIDRHSGYCCGGYKNNAKQANKLLETIVNVCVCVFVSTFPAVWIHAALPHDVSTLVLCRLLWVWHLDGQYTVTVSFLNRLQLKDNPPPFSDNVMSLM